MKSKIVAYLFHDDTVETYDRWCKYVNIFFYNLGQTEFIATSITAVDSFLAFNFHEASAISVLLSWTAAFCIKNQVFCMGCPLLFQILIYIVYIILLCSTKYRFGRYRATRARVMTGTDIILCVLEYRFNIVVLSRASIH